MTKENANNLSTDMTVGVVLKHTKTVLMVCSKLKETVVKNHKDWQIAKI